MTDIQAILTHRRIAALSVLVVFGLLATAVETGSTEKLDFMVSNMVHRIASPDLTAFMKVATNLGSVAIIAAFLGAALIGFWLAGDPDAVSLLAWAMGAAVVLENGIKFAVQRPRPEPFFNIVAPETFSFPSGHTLFSTCFYGMIAYLLGARAQNSWCRVAIWALAATVVGLVGFSRIYLGVHYPTDVLAGYLAAVFCLCAVRWWRPSAAKAPPTLGR